MQAPHRVLFVCSDNAIHGRLAEASLQRLARGRYRADSAGLTAAPALPAVIDSLQRIGYAVVDPQPKPTVFELHANGDRFDYIIDFCAEAAEPECPVFTGVLRHLRWPAAELPTADPQSSVSIDALRDVILLKVSEWLIARRSIRRLPGDANG